MWRCLLWGERLYVVEWYSSSRKYYTKEGRKVGMRIKHKGGNTISTGCTGGNGRRGGRSRKCPCRKVIVGYKEDTSYPESERKLEQKSVWHFCRRNYWNEVQGGQRGRNSWDRSGAQHLKRNLDVKEGQGKHLISLLISLSQGQAESRNGKERGKPKELNH